MHNTTINHKLFSRTAQTGMCLKYKFHVFSAQKAQYAPFFGVPRNGHISGILVIIRNKLSNKTC